MGEGATAGIWELALATRNGGADGGRGHRGDLGVGARNSKRIQTNGKLEFTKKLETGSRALEMGPARRFLGRLNPFGADLSVYQ